MAYIPRYYTPDQLERIVADAEAELDRREAQRAEADRLERVRQWTLDPRNAGQLAKIRQELDRVAPQRPTQPQAPQRPQAPTPAPQYKTREQLERERPWLRDPRPGSFGKIVDPYVR